MSRLPIVVDYHDREEPGRKQLLALRGLRRNLERLATGFQTHRVEPVEVTRDELVRELRELITALDRRVARVEQAGEAAIARDAAALRERAMRRLAELASEAAPAGFDVPDHLA